MPPRRTGFFHRIHMPQGQRTLTEVDGDDEAKKAAEDADMNTGEDASEKPPESPRPRIVGEIEQL